MRPVKLTHPSVPTQIIERNLTIIQVNRNIADIALWKSAIRSFENVVNPNRTALYDLYETVVLDGQIEATWGKRRDYILNKPLLFKRDGKEDEELTKLLNSPNMRQLVRDIHEAIIWGYSLLQISNIYWDDLQEVYVIDYDLIPRKHVHPEKNFECISVNQSSASRDMLFKESPLNDYLIEAGEPTAKGLLVKASPYVIYKNGGISDWAQFSEMFGMPFREFKYDDFDNETRRKLEEMCQNWGAAMWAVAPKSAELKIHDTSGSAGSNTIFKDLTFFCDAAISKIIVGNTLTTEQGNSGARSLGEVHMEIEDQKKQSDELFVLSVLNTQFRKVLNKFGFNVKGGEIWYKSPETDWNKQRVKWNVLSSISNKLPVDDDYLYDEMDIPKPADYEQRKQAMSAQQFQLPEDTRFENLSNPVKKSLMERVLNFFVNAPSQAMRDGASNGKTLTNNTNTEIVALIERVWNKEATYWDADLFCIISNNLLAGLSKGLKSPIERIGTIQNSIEYGLPDPAMQMALEQNLFHFSAAKTLAELQALNQALNESKDFSEFRQKVNQITDTFNKRWQQTEYNTAVNCAEAAANYTRLKSKTRLFPFWQYKTIGDERVRAEHQALHDVILSHDDPRWDKIYPPNGWRCRCFVIGKMAHEAPENIAAEQGRVEEYMQTKDWQNAVSQRWNINRSKNELVFDANQMYIRKFPEMAAKYMDKLKPSDWGLNNSIKKLQDAAATPTIPYTGTAEEFWKANKVIVNKVELLPVTDYANRTWYMEKGDFDIHTTNKYKSRENRVILLNHINEIAQNPDEVWLGRDNRDFQFTEMKLTNYVMIKYYKDKTIAVACKIKDGKLHFRTFYELKDKKVRRGYLLKKR